ncbi:MAG: mechanosensitive ion channel [Planctomycetia bacterium]|nr:mechanosensitive ion channel [Planctomycetia bacterium]
MALLPVGVAAGADGSPEKTPSEWLTIELVQTRMKQLGDLPNLDEATRAKAQALLQQAVAQLESAETLATRAKRYEERIASAKQDVERAKAGQDAPAGQVAAPQPGMPLADLERAFAEKETELQNKKAELANLEAEAKRRAGRRAELPKLVADARERLAAIDQARQSAAPADEHAQVAAARRLLLAAQRRTVEREIAVYDLEPKAYEAQTQLLPLERDVAGAQVARMEQTVARWREAVDRRRKEETEAQLQRARQQVNQAQPAMARLAERNAQRAERRKELAQLIERTGQQLDETDQTLATMRDQFTRVKEKLEAVGQTNAIGLLLRQQRDTLPDLRTHRQNVANRQSVISDIRLERLQLDDRRSELANLDLQVQKELQAMQPERKAADPGDLEAALREALEAEKEYLVALMVDANVYFDKLIDLDTAEQRLIEETEAYAKYADERVLWIRSASAFGVEDFRHLGQGAIWLAQPGQWIELGRGLVRDARRSPAPLAVAVLLLGLVVYSYWRAKRKISDIGEVAARATCFRLFPTVEAMFLTVLVAAVWPCLLWHVAWRLGVGLGESAFAKAVADGLGLTAGLYLALGLLDQLCRPGGLAGAHFDWPDCNLRILRRYAHWAMVLVLPLGFVAVAADTHGDVDALGRLSFALAMLISSLMVARALRPGGSIFQAIVAGGASGWFSRLRFVWYPAGWMLPLALAVLAMMGYYYTAQQLAGRIAITAGLVLGVVLTRSFLLRWVLMRRRHLAMKQARQRRAAAQADARPSGDAAVGSVIPAPAAPNLDLATINTQTRHLVEYSLAVACFVGIWLAWVDVLPALRGLERVVLWQAIGDSNAFTLADLGIAALVAMTSLIAAKNIPGLLEMTLLQRLSVEPAVRYTIGTVSRYAITVVGLVSVCHSVGISWDKVQWLVAAISVGLGFGLQEIFANFISGLIILFERPIRVGDIVTVAEVSGVVSRIRMRATTITNWDRKEFIVPNKEFVTGRLLNWTLSDQVNRVVVNVGIAYGSDTELATELLLRAAREHPQVLGDPEPSVCFEAFGDSALSFVLRCYLPNMEKRSATIHELHMEVDRKLREAGIEIAFPQRDVHVRMDANSLVPFATAAKAEANPVAVPEDAAKASKPRRAA